MKILDHFILFRRKVHRVVDPEETEKRLKEEPLEFEKGDTKALILAAFAVFGPVVILFGGLVALLFFLFTR